MKEEKPGLTDQRFKTDTGFIIYNILLTFAAVIFIWAWGHSVVKAHGFWSKTAHVFIPFISWYDVSEELYQRYLTESQCHAQLEKDPASTR